MAADIQRGGPRAGLGSRLGRPCNTRARFLDSCFVLSFTPPTPRGSLVRVSVLGQGRNRVRLRSWARRVTRGPLHRVTADGNGASPSNPRAPWPPLESITGQTASSSCARRAENLNRAFGACNAVPLQEPDNCSEQFVARDRPIHTRCTELPTRLASRISAAKKYCAPSLFVQENAPEFFAPGIH